MPDRAQQPLAHADGPPSGTRPGAGFARWHPRRLMAATSRLGLQGRVISAFIAILTLALGATVIVYVRHTGAQLSDLIGEQARQMAASLALTNERAVRLNRGEELTRIGKELIKSRNVLFVGFYDADGDRVAVSSRDADVDLKDVSAVRASTSLLMQARRERSRLFGHYVQTVAPVLSIGEGGESKLVGYVAVGVSEEGEAARMRETARVIVVIAVLALALSAMVGWALVHRLFQPIRGLVSATHKIIAGDLDTRVDVERTDVIGTLARAFNEMVIWVKQQQRDLATANEKLLDANHDLEEKVAQRTAQLETANNRLSTEIAEKEAFLRAVSHDLNAPLRNIDGMASMLLLKYRDKLDEDVVHRLERIKKNVEHETGLITELLELSRIKTRRQKMEMVEIEPLVRQLRDVFENDLKTRDIKLVIRSPLPVLECERARLRQVFQNLIDNAIKYMGEPPDGGTEHAGPAAGPAAGTAAGRKPREIHVGCTMRMTEAEFYVRDTGIGIEPEDLDKVFQVFRRGRSAAVNAVAGKGVGLASVRSIIETYNGRIWVESKLGEGSTFKFTINGRFVPAAAAVEAARAKRADGAADEEGDEPGVPHPTRATNRAA
jgi:signal transduction histidine kinase